MSFLWMFPKIILADEPGIPSTDPNFSQDVETWWGSHPMNPDNPAGYSIGYVPHPPTVIEIEPDGGCTIGTNIQDALDALPAVPTTGYTFQLEAGTYCGDFRITNDYDSDGAGGFTQTLKRDNIHILGDSDGGTILKTSYHYTSESHYDNAYADRVELEILGCPEAADYAGFSGSRNPASLIHDKSNYCIANPIRNIYFNNIIFDGDGVSSILVHTASSRDVVLDNFTFRNTSGTGIGNHDGSFYGVATITNIWCRKCTFSSTEEYQIYHDGLHGGGVIYSTIDGGTTTGGLLYLTNDDFTRDRNDSGTVTEEEWGIGNYIVVYKNTFTGKESSSTYNGIALVGAHSLIKDNLVNGKVNSFVYENPKSSRIVQYGGVTPSVTKYSYVDNRIIDNRVRATNQLIFVDQAADVCNPTDVPTTYNVGKCADIGESIVEGNDIYSHLTAIFVKESWNGSYEGDEHILPSSLSDNCATGGQFADGDTPGSSGGAALAVSTTTACSRSIPAGPTSTSQNIVPNYSFETVTSFPTSWQQRASASSDTSQFFSGTKSLKLTGAASGIYVNNTGNILASLLPSTEYFLNARVKATTINTPASSFTRLRFNDITNGPTYNTANISTTASYWKYTTAKFTTAASTANVRLDVLHTFESGDAVYVDDIELYPSANHAELISFPTINDAVAPTGSVAAQGGQTNITSNTANLTLTGADNFDSSSYLHMQISENADFSGASWESYSASDTFTLSAGTGDKTVYVRFRDVHQNTSSTYTLTLNVGTASSNNSSSSSSPATSGNSQSGSCSAASPSEIPDLFQIDTNSDTATIYFAPVSGATKYSVGYGYADKEDLFIAELQVTGFKIGGLAANTNYFIRLRAVNDCVPGEWGKTIIVKTTSGANKIGKFYKNQKPVLVNNPKAVVKQSQKTTGGTKPVAVPIAKDVRTQEPQPVQQPAVVTQPVTQTVSQGSLSDGGWFNGFVTSVKKIFGF